jgi:predicted PurR-regulated permease PerM
MKDMKSTSTEKYFIFILLLIVTIITFLIVYPFLSILILAAAFAVVLNPICNWIKKHIVKDILGLPQL